MFILSFGLCLGLATAEVIKMTNANRNVALAEDKVSFVNFYADWCRYPLSVLILVVEHCRFSRQLAPIFEAAERELASEEQLVFARVDCDKDGDICKEFMVNKVRSRFAFLPLLYFVLSVPNDQIVPSWKATEKGIQRPKKRRCNQGFSAGPDSRPNYQSQGVERNRRSYCPGKAHQIDGNMKFVQLEADFSLGCRLF